MTIPSLQFIEDKAKENGLIMIKGCSVPPPFQIDLLESENALDKFFSLVKSLSKTVFFIDAAIYDRETLEDYCIDLDLITEGDYGDVAQAIRKEAVKHNKLLMNLPIDQPAGLELFVFADGCSYSLEFDEDWHNLIEEPERVLDRICSVYDEKISNYKMQKSAQKSADEAQKLKELEQVIINDSTFLYCTTKDARFRFVYKLISEGNISIHMNRVEMQAWVDLLWAQLKAKKV